MSPFKDGWRHFGGGWFLKNSPVDFRIFSRQKTALHQCLCRNKMSSVFKFIRGRQTSCKWLSVKFDPSSFNCAHEYVPNSRRRKLSRQVWKAAPENSFKMREIVHLQAGQCGNQIGAKVRKRGIYKIGVLANELSLLTKLKWGLTCHVGRRCWSMLIIVLKITM